MARGAPKRVVDPTEPDAGAPDVETQAPAPAEPEAPHTADAARAAIDQHLKAAQPDRATPELNDAQRQQRFTETVRSRLASPAHKDGTPAPRRQLPMARLQLQSAAFRVWDAIVEEGTTFEDVLEPAYWAHCSRKFNPWDQIIVRAEHGTFYAELIVREVAQLWIRVVAKPGYPISVDVTEPDVDGSLPPGFEIKWRGEFNGYCVVRNGQVIKEKCLNRATASAWVRDLMRANRVMRA